MDWNDIVLLDSVKEEGEIKKEELDIKSENNVKDELRDTETEEEDDDDEDVDCITNKKEKSQQQLEESILGGRRALVRLERFPNVQKSIQIKGGKREMVIRDIEDRWKKYPATIQPSKEERQRDEEILKGAPLTDNVGSFCKFSCQTCSKKSSSITMINKHLRETNHGTQRYSLSGPQIEVKREKIFVHKCKICSKLLLCDLRIFKAHFATHTTTVKSYCAKFGCQQVLRGEVQAQTKEKTIQTSNGQKLTPTQTILYRICESAPLSKDAGSLCLFRCDKCHVERVSWGGLRNHLISTKHGPKNIAFIERYLVKAVAHKCQICSEKILSEAQFLSLHMMQYHQTTIKQYCAKFRLKGETIRKGLKHDVFEVDNFELARGAKWNRSVGQNCQQHTRRKDRSRKMKDLCFKGSLTDQCKGALCRFFCPTCKEEWQTWLKFHKHICKGTKIHIRTSEVHKYITKVVCHKCRICSERVLCDGTFLPFHMSTKHKLTVTKYRQNWLGLTAKKNPYDHETTIMMRNLCKKAKLSDELRGELCSFGCPNCKGEWQTWVKFCNHVCNGTKIHVSVSDVHKYVTKNVAHECRICSDRVLCDATFTSGHMSKHNISVIKYRQDWLGKAPKKNPYENEAVKKVAKAANVFVEVPLGGQCQYHCQKCGKSSVRWATFRNHGCVSGTASLQAHDLLNVVTKPVTHQCKICLERVLCDKTILSAHMMYSHSMNVPQYCRTFSLKDNSSLKLKHILESARETKETEQNQCTFHCKECKQDFAYWGLFSKHRCKEGLVRISKVDVLKHIQEVVVHECKICHAKLFADSSFLNLHLKNIHKLSMLQYREKYQCPGAYQEEKATLARGILTDDIGTLCRFGCKQCPKTFLSVRGCYWHMREKGHGKPSFRVEKQNFIELYTHKCKLCSVTFACATYYMQKHFRHAHGKMSIDEYCKKTNTRHISGDEDEKANVLSSSAGNFCEFKCNVCGLKDSSWKRMRQHLRKENHDGQIGSNAASRHITKKVHHACLICGKKTLCDWAMIVHHLRKSHGISQLEYCRRTGQARPKSRATN